MAIKVTTDSYHIASVRCHQMKYGDGSVVIEDDSEVWLSVSGSHPTCHQSKSNARRFRADEVSGIKGRIAQWDGMPWYYRIKPGTLRIFKVTRKETIEETIEEIGLN